MANTKRIAKELEQFNKHDSDSNRVYLCTVEDNLLDLRGLVIGPTDTPFEGAFLYFSIIPENYPHSPPKVQFLTPYSGECRMHPNLYQTGKVCLSILGTWGKMDWSPLLTFEKILLTIQGLLDDNPITHEPSFENVSKKEKRGMDYSIQSRWLVLNSVMYMLNREDIHPFFKSVMRDFFESNADLYRKSVKILEPYNGETIKTLHGLHKIDISTLSFFFKI